MGSGWEMDGELEGLIGRRWDWGDGTKVVVEA